MDEVLVMSINEITLEFYKKTKEMYSSETEKGRETKPVSNSSENKGDDFSKNLKEQINNIKKRDINRR